MKMTIPFLFVAALSIGCTTTPTRPSDRYTYPAYDFCVLVEDDHPSHPHRRYVVTPWEVWMDSAEDPVVHLSAQQASRVRSLVEAVQFRKVFEDVFGEPRDGGHFAALGLSLWRPGYAAKIRVYDSVQDAGVVSFVSGLNPVMPPTDAIDLSGKPERIAEKGNPKPSADSPDGKRFFIHVREDFGASGDWHEYLIVPGRIWMACYPDPVRLSEKQTGEIISTIDGMEIQKLKSAFDSNVMDGFDLTVEIWREGQKPVTVSVSNADHPQIARLTGLIKQFLPEDHKIVVPERKKKTED